MNTMNDEVKAVRAALKAAGYEIIKCNHGTGTVYCYINVEVLAPESLNCYEEPDEQGYRRFTCEYSEYLSGVYTLVKYAAGREDRHDDSYSDYFPEKLSVNVIPRDQYEIDQAWKKEQKEKKEKGKICPDCGKKVTTSSRTGYRWIRTCPDCGASWRA